MDDTNGEDVIVVDLDEDVTLDLETVDVGTADEGAVLAFTIEGVLRGLESDRMDQLAETSVVPTAIKFRVERE